MRIAVEFYGVPRLRAGTGLLHLEASTVGQAMNELGRVCPALAQSVLRPDLLHTIFKLSLNGERFVSDPETPLADGDVLLLLSADAGG
jgi:molybdopterin converting factor small subunit